MHKHYEVHNTITQQARETRHHQHHYHHDNVHLPRTSTRTKNADESLAKFNPFLEDSVRHRPVSLQLPIKHILTR